ncbi:hypothetical protein KBD87_02965 [Candidatus Saccharibacteria bacterium]|nr:hypothetical protein [Candidatus Saccharibacteria bacterium]
MGAMEILVTILSIFLAVFLLAGIILAILLIRITRQIRRVTTTAEKTALSLQGFASNVTKFSSPMLIAKFVAEQVKKYQKDKEK